MSLFAPAVHTLESPSAIRIHHIADANETYPAVDCAVTEQAPVVWMGSRDEMEKLR